MKYKDLMIKLTKIFTITLFGSLIAIIIYLSVNKISYIDPFNSSFNGYSINVNTSSKKFSFDWTDFIPSFSFNKDNAKKYEKLSDTIIETFSTNIENIDISCSVADINFIQEDRDDIKVEYSYSKPDTVKYKVNFDVQNSTDTLKITQKITSINIAPNFNGNHYKNDINIYVPTNYTVDELVIRNSLGDIENSDFFDSATNINFDASLGDINAEFNSPKNSVTLNASLGDISLTNHSTIENLGVYASAGKIDIKSTGAITDVVASDSMGNITLDSTEKIDTCKLNANMGNIKAYFKKPLDKFNIEANMGDIELNLADNDSINIYAKTSMGKVTSDFPILKNSDTKNTFYVKCDMGDISIKNK